MKSPTSMVAPCVRSAILTPPMKAALRLLLEAHDTALRLDRDYWEFALEIRALREAGLSHNDLRVLVCQGFAEHRLEQTRLGAEHRVFRAPRSLRLQPSSCFTLSALGLRLARHDSPPEPVLPRPPAEKGEIEVPFWDADRRELRLGNRIVKRFRQPAKNQETILAAFQEDGWPPHIDNPLPGSADIDAVDRLHDAVKMLNRHTREVIRFFSDGVGSGVIWQLADAGVLGAS